MLFLIIMWLAKATQYNITSDLKQYSMCTEHASFNAQNANVIA